jgi:predicted Zn-dependent protease
LRSTARDNLFSTHPATANRIAELRALAGAAESDALPGMDLYPDARQRPVQGAQTSANGQPVSSVPISGKKRPKGPWG